MFDWSRYLSSSVASHLARKEREKKLRERFEAASRLLEEPPDGRRVTFRSWKVATDAAGITRVRRSRLSQITGGWSAFLLLVFFGIFLLLALWNIPRIPSPREMPLAWFGFLGLLAGFLYALGSLLWSLFGSEEWRVGSGLLEVRKRLLRWEWTRQYRRAALVIASRSPNWYLSAETAEGKALLTVSTVAGWKPEDPRELRALAMLIAEQNGWPLRVEAP